jgi:hypothetical protein
VLDPTKRFLTVILALGIIALIAGIALGERAGDRVIGQVTEKRLDSIAPITVTPAPVQRNSTPYGPDWKRTDVMAAAPDPGFPDPRVPPKALPTATPAPKYHKTPAPLAEPQATPTPNLNLPIWRRMAPLPTPTPTPVPGPSLQPNGEPVGEPSSDP